MSELQTNQPSTMTEDESEKTLANIDTMSDARLAELLRDPDIAWMPLRDQLLREAIARLLLANKPSIDFTAEYPTNPETR